MNDLIVEYSPPVMRLILNRHAKKNALSIELLKSMLDALQSIPADVKVVVLEGSKSFFCTGLDLEEAQKSSQGVETLAKVYEALFNLPVITIAKVQGGAMAGGIGLLAACDFALASDTTIFALPELQRGLVPGLVFTLLEEQIQPRSLNALILNGKRILAAKAYAIGLVQEVVPESELDSFLDEMIHSLLKNAPMATQTYKKQYRNRNLAEKFEKALKLHHELLGQEEAKEGMKAFIKKRLPDWQ